jgi:phenylacetate-CoA ligase
MSGDQLNCLQVRKLKELVIDAYQNVPHYHDLMDKSGISPDQIQSIDDIRRFPITNKSILQKYPTNYVLNRRFSLDRLFHERSSGSTGQPFTVYYDSAYQMTRNLLFLRALFAIGYRLGQKLILISSRARRSIPPLRWHYLPLEMPVDQILGAILKANPSVLYGPRTILIRMAETMSAKAVTIPKLSKIVSTAESLSASDRRLLTKVFRCRIFDFYGSTEMGLVAWECVRQEGYHLSTDRLLIEYLPVDNVTNSYRLVVTNLDLAAMPLIRFDTGDIVEPAVQQACMCGRRLPKLQQIEGRYIDCIKQADGVTLTPYQINCAIEKLPEIGQYKIIQNSYHDLNVKINLLYGDPLIVEKNIKVILQSFFNSAMNITVDFNESLDTSSIRKSRVVESRIVEISDENSLH